MRGVWEYRVCSVHCSVKESVCRIGLVDIRTWHSQYSL